MVAYHEFLAWSQSPDSTVRGQAAHHAASAFIAGGRSASEQAALYAAVMAFLDDPSVKVRAALAYGLLHSLAAPRPVMLALLHDAPVIARAVGQYSPVLLDADLLPLVPEADETLLVALAGRKGLGPSLLKALLARGNRRAALTLLAREELCVAPASFAVLAEAAATDPGLRGALLRRPDLPAGLRLDLVDQVRAALGGLRLVRGAVAPRRLQRLLRDARNMALTEIGEGEALAGRSDFVSGLANGEGLSSRLLIHALLNGQVQFFAASISALSGVPAAKIISLLERGARPVLVAIFSRCGMGQTLADLLARLVLLARSTRLADDVSARYFVVIAAIEDLVIAYGGDIPESLTDSFGYLNEQAVVLGRRAARGVLASFAAEAGVKTLPRSAAATTALVAA